MGPSNDNIPEPKELEKEISNFLARKFGKNVKVISPNVLHEEETDGQGKTGIADEHPSIDFSLKPEELIAWLDQFIVKQDEAKAILATKICTHFNRIRQFEQAAGNVNELVGNVKNNVLMLGPTGVGKTYMIKLIAKKLGVPFVKGDATKFSETGYVGGDVEDLVRDLVREADGDIELAQYGIIYIDEIDKIASSRNMIGADVSRTGVQRALLKPLEETDVELKVPHDPISMIQEIERFRKTGKRDRSTINTRHILFIMSGAFAELQEIIRKRITSKHIGFGAQLPSTDDSDTMDILKQVKSEDLINFGFESEFVGRLPVRAIFEKLKEKDLLQILMNPNNPIILGKKLDFAAYGIDIKFEKELLRSMAKNAFAENTGARGLVSAVETALLPFEKKLPSSTIKSFPATLNIINSPETHLKDLIADPEDRKWQDLFEQVTDEEKNRLHDFIQSDLQRISARHGIDLTSSRIEMIVNYYCTHVITVGNAVKRIRGCYEEIKSLELYFFKSHDINIVLEDDAIDYLIERMLSTGVKTETMYSKLSSDFEHGLKLILEKTGKNRFFINRQALMDPNAFLNTLVKSELNL